MLNIIYTIALLKSMPFVPIFLISFLKLFSICLLPAPVKTCDPEDILPAFCLRIDARRKQAMLLHII